MKIGFLFPGQGSQTIGMGKDLYKNYEIVKEIYDNSEKITDIPIKKLSFEGPEEELNKTQNTQLAILTMSIAIAKLLESENIKSDISAGLSLGEYSALIDSKAITFEDGLKIVKARGKYMQELCPKGNWKMAAIIGLNEEQVNEGISKVKSGFVKAVNFNTEGQIVLSGEADAIEEACTYLKELGAKRAMPLNTAGPFHTDKLIESSKALKQELEKYNFNKVENKVIKNITGDTYYTNEDNIKEILAEHIINPVQFKKTLEKMLEEGIDTFIEIGPGKTLSGFLKRIQTDKEIKILNISDVETYKNTLSILKGEQ